MLHHLGGSLANRADSEKCDVTGTKLDELNPPHLIYTARVQSLSERKTANSPRLVNQARNYIFIAPTSPPMASTSIPHRGTGLSEEAVPTSDPSDTTALLLERLQAYKHACGYIEDWVTAEEKAQKAQAKEYEKILKTVSSPLREGHQFDQQLGGIAGLFESIRSNTQGVANARLENEKNLKGAVLPILERLHVEIKNKTSELNKGTAKGSKEVDKSRQATQKHIEMLGQHSASFTSAGGRVDAANDPYLLQRGINHRLHKQVLEENSNRQDLIAVQDSFATFEAHIIETFQQALATFLQYEAGTLEREKSSKSRILISSSKIFGGICPSITTVPL